MQSTMFPRTQIQNCHIHLFSIYFTISQTIMARLSCSLYVGKRMEYLSTTSVRLPTVPDTSVMSAPNQQAHRHDRPRLILRYATAYPHVTCMATNMSEKQLAIIIRVLAYEALNIQAETRGVMCCSLVHL